MDTLEGNKLIAESPFVPQVHAIWIAKYKNTAKEIVHASIAEREAPFPYDKLNYHKSFDAIMPVVRSIKQLKIEDFRKKRPITFALMDVDINILYSAVVVFIQWYNQQSKANQTVSV